MSTGKLFDGSYGSVDSEQVEMARLAAEGGMESIGGGITGRSKRKAMYKDLKGMAGCDNDEGGNKDKAGGGGEADTWDNGGS